MVHRMSLYRKMTLGLLAALSSGMAIPVYSFAGPREVISEGADYLRELRETYKRYRNGEASREERERIERITFVVKGAALTAAIVIAYYWGKGLCGACFRQECYIINGRSLPVIQKSTDEKIVQIKVVQQIGETCGFHAIVNTKNILAMICGNEKQVDDVMGEIEVLQADRKAHLRENPEFGENPADQTLTPDDVHACFKHFGITEDCIMFAPENGFLGKYIVSEGPALSARIVQFKNNKEKNGLAIIINPGDHWFVDVLRKREDGSCQHIIADSMNENQVSGKAVKLVIAAEKSAK